MKKLSILLAFVLCAGFLTACNTNEKRKEKYNRKIYLTEEDYLEDLSKDAVKERRETPPNVESEYILSSLDEEESSHIETEDGHTFLIFDVPYVERDKEDIIYATMPIGVVVVPDHVITISLKDNPVIMDFSQGVVKNVQTAYKTSFVLTMLFRMATRFLQYLN